MRRSLLLAAALAAALLLPATAAAKGPASATITGPGLDHAITIAGDGEGSPSSPLGVLIMQGGFFAQVFGQSPDPTFLKRPAEWLGPRYLVTYTMPGQNGDSKLRQALYPYAAKGPATYMARGQLFWEVQSTIGGWVRGTSSLRQMLVAAGLPAAAPARKSTGGYRIGVAIAAGAGVAAAAGLLALRRRRQHPSG
ncbi:MAG TPA: hypothetical protein VFU26_15295 [Gaiellaceae bacterium]|nr:hypothetical protein [Gaiellaceae bacterium]